MKAQSASHLSRGPCVEDVVPCEDEGCESAGADKNNQEAGAAGAGGGSPPADADAQHHRPRGGGGRRRRRRRKGEDGALQGRPPEDDEEGGAPGGPAPPPPPPGEPPGAAPEPPPPPPPRGTCLAANWQEERATNPLDGPEGGAPESFRWRHGHRGLLSLQFEARPASSTTAKDSYRRPPSRRTDLPARGQRQALLEWQLYQKHSKDVFEEEVAVSHPPMESQSITHRDYSQGGFLSEPPAPTKPHDYRLEQAQSFWMEHARQVTGVSSIQTSDTPFKKCAAFTTPVTEFLDQPVPHDPESYPKL
ncbi:hypothetical protein JRQ81_013040 [Phrynocephalus forsythii]|uniref:Sperm-associated antigen 8 n=1 Tax=Phrynocephalus forsythii TaxID=171643 RepID=A0A9Q1B4K4_9SAUR|nr:hypothetical protein JRQ81_013040 [Phrynocephalus forsythii]